MCLIHQTGLVELYPFDTSHGPSQIANTICNQCLEKDVEVLVETENPSFGEMLYKAIIEQMQHGSQRTA